MKLIRKPSGYIILFHGESGLWSSLVLLGAGLHYIKRMSANEFALFKQI